jgi:hypothetical protein
MRLSSVLFLVVATVGCKGRQHGAADAAPSVSVVAPPASTPASSATPLPDAPPPVSRIALPGAVAWQAPRIVMAPPPATPVALHGTVTLLASDPAGLVIAGANDAYVYALVGAHSYHGLVTRVPRDGGPSATMDLGAIVIASLAVTEHFLYLLDERVAQGHRMGRIFRVPVAGGPLEALADDLAEPCGLVSDGTTLVWREASGLRALATPAGTSGANGRTPSTVFEGDVGCSLALDGGDIVFSAAHERGVAIARTAIMGGRVTYGERDIALLPALAAVMQEQMLRAMSPDSGPFDAGGPPSRIGRYASIFQIESRGGTISYVGKPADGVAQAVVRTRLDQPGQPILYSGQTLALTTDGATTYEAIRNDNLAGIVAITGAKISTLVEDMLFHPRSTDGDVVKILARHGAVVWSDASTQGRGGAIWSLRP